MEFTLLGAAAVAMAAMWIWTRLDRALAGTPDPFGTLLSATIVGLAVGRVAAMVATGTNPISFDVLLVRGGVSTVGASVGAAGWLIWSIRGDRVRADLLAPAALAGLAGWHAGCLARGACLGAATDLPWGWGLTGSPVDRHPVELYGAALFLAGAWAMKTLQSRNTPAGTTAAAAIGVAGLARLATEPLRLTLGQLSWFYGAAVAVGVAAVAVLVLNRSEDGQLRSREHHPEENEKHLREQD